MVPSRPQVLVLSLELNYCKGLPSLERHRDIQGLSRVTVLLPGPLGKEGVWRCGEGYWRAQL